jgi:hypothetical protein
MAVIPSWLGSATAGFVVSLVVTIAYKRPSNREELLQVLSYPPNLSMALGCALALAVSDVAF